MLVYATNSAMVFIIRKSPADSRRELPYVFGVVTQTQTPKMVVAGEDEEKFAQVKRPLLLKWVDIIFRTYMQIVKPGVEAAAP